MSDECLFCQIVAGDIPGNTLYETDTVLAFLDANPLAEGHALVIPKDHYHRLNDVPEDVATDLFSAIHRIVPAVEAVVDAPATTVAFNNGEEAGQEVPHVHGHVVPRDEDDGAGPIHSLFSGRQGVSDEEMAEIADRIQSSL